MVDYLYRYDIGIKKGKTEKGREVVVVIQLLIHSFVIRLTDWVCPSGHPPGCLIPRHDAQNLQYQKYTILRVMISERRQHEPANNTRAKSHTPERVD
jgi:hypothetical protein